MDRRNLVKGFALGALAASLPRYALSQRAKSTAGAKALKQGSDTLFVFFHGSWLFVEDSDWISALTPSLSDHNNSTTGTNHNELPYGSGYYFLDGVASTPRSPSSTSVVVSGSNHFVIPRIVPSSNAKSQVNYNSPGLRHIQLPLPNNVYPTNLVQTGNLPVRGNDVSVIGQSLTYSSHYVFEYKNVDASSLSFQGIDDSPRKTLGGYKFHFFTTPKMIDSSGEHAVNAFNAMIALFNNLDIFLVFDSKSGKGAHINCFDAGTHDCSKGKGVPCILPVGVSPEEAGIEQCESSHVNRGPQLACDSPSGWLPPS